VLDERSDLDDWKGTASGWVDLHGQIPPPQQVGQGSGSDSQKSVMSLQWTETPGCVLQSKFWCVSQEMGEGPNRQVVVALQHGTLHFFFMPSQLTRPHLDVQLVVPVQDTTCPSWHVVVAVQLADA
jgi:hypothetical protein